MVDQTEPKVKDSISAFKAEKKYAWYEKYKAGADVDKTALDTSTFDTYEQSRIKDISSFSTIKSSGGNSLTEKLKAAPNGSAGQTVKGQLNKVFQSPALTTAQKNFKDEISTLNKLIATEPPSVHPKDMGSCLLELKSEAVQAINAQHTAALEKLNQLFGENDFKRDLCATLDCGEDELPRIKNEMVATLNKSNQEARANLEKSIEDSANKLFNASRIQIERLAFLGDRYNRDKAMKADIDKQLAQSDASIEFNFENGDAIFRGVDINRLQVFNTIQGRSITKNADGSLTMQLNRIYQSDESIRKDVASLVQTLKAMGKETITLNITNKDPKQAEYDARLALEGAIAAGADPKKLRIEVNGEVKFSYNAEGVYDKKELFQQHGERLKIALGNAEKIAEKTDLRIKGTDSTRSLRERLREMNRDLPSLTPSSGPGLNG